MNLLELCKIRELNHDGKMSPKSWHIGSSRYDMVHKVPVLYWSIEVKIIHIQKEGPYVYSKKILY